MNGYPIVELDLREYLHAYIHSLAKLTKLFALRFFVIFFIVVAVFSVGTTRALRAQVVVTSGCFELMKRMCAWIFCEFRS